MKNKKMKKIFLNEFEKARKPDKLNILYLFKDYLDNKEFSITLSYWWIQTEFPNQYPKYILLELFKKADKKIMMGENYQAYLNLPDLVRVYRGVQDCSIKGKMEIKAFSWTTDINKARWFASRWEKDGSGKLYSALIPKHFIFMFNNGREEKEIVLNPNKLRNITELKGEKEYSIKFKQEVKNDRKRTF